MLNVVEKTALKGIQSSFYYWKDETFKIASKMDAIL
jgi:hypothetical protein